MKNVFYQLAAGDHLVVNHPAGTPLLRVIDPAAPTTPLYAAAIAPFGNGWAVVVPRLVEQQRADGAAFIQNLMRFVQSVSATRRIDEQPFAPRALTSDFLQSVVGLPISLIELASKVASKDDDQDSDWETLARAWDEAAEGRSSPIQADPDDVFHKPSQAQLILGRMEAVIIRRFLSGAVWDKTDGVETRKDEFRAIAFVLRARLEMQRADLKGATTWLLLANNLAPASAEVLFWRGALAATQAQNLTLASPVRAQLLNDAARNWASASNAVATGKDAQAAPSAISGIPLAAIQNWVAIASRESNLARAEPPLVRIVGTSGRLVIFRHFANDPTLGLALPAASMLAGTNNELGWGVEAEEILIFPTDQYYATYTAAARTGARGMTFNPLTQRGNVIDNRILMVSQNTTPILLPGPPPRFVRLSAAVPAVIGRLHSQVLLNALTEGGTIVPTWMQLGLMSLSNASVVNSLTGASSMSGSTLPAGTIGAMLSPEQFRGVNVGDDRNGLIEVQARRLMQFFYIRFGAGAVAETLQRLGAGESADAALRATTGMTETQFFIAWRNAGSGR